MELTDTSNDILFLFSSRLSNTLNPASRIITITIKALPDTSSAFEVDHVSKPGSSCSGVIYF